MRNIFTVILCFLPILIGCNSEQLKSEKIKTIVSIPPQEFFVRKIADTLVDISVLIPAGQSPTTYNPTPQQMIDIENSDLLFTIGVPFEKHLLNNLNTNNLKIKIVKTQDGIELLPMTGHDDDHDHGALDPHIWLDPELVKLQAKNIADALIEIAPEHKVLFKNNLELFKNELDSVDVLIDNILSKYNKRHICAFHPSFGYFCEAYGLKQIAIEIEGKEPTAKELAGFVMMTEQEKITTIFIQPQFSDKSARVIAESIHGKVETLDPLSSDYYNNLIEMVHKIASSFEEK
ncbi:MAG: zinc ABC transporter substrate-binding protein [bacterium]